MTKIQTCIYRSPVGPLYLGASHGRLTHCLWQPFDTSPSNEDDALQNRNILAAACTQLDEYFAGRRRVFDVPLNVIQTPFRMRILTEMAKIPYGETCTYGDLAKAIGNPGAVRATGSACKTNPLAIFIPCHRVITASGAIGQYAGGADAKRYLLNLENTF